MYVYFITYPLILITSPAAILNSINLFYLLETALVLTLDNFHSIFPPFLPSSCPALTLVALIQNCHMASSLLCVHIHLLFSDWERHLWLSKVSVKLPCVYVCLSSGDPFIFSVKISSFFFYFCVICTLALSLSTWLDSIIWNIIYYFYKIIALSYVYYCYSSEAWSVRKREMNADW